MTSGSDKGIGQASDRARRLSDAGLVSVSDSVPGGIGRKISTVVMPLLDLVPGEKVPSPRGEGNTTYRRASDTPAWNYGHNFKLQPQDNIDVTEKHALPRQGDKFDQKRGIRRQLEVADSEVTQVPGTTEKTISSTICSLSPPDLLHAINAPMSVFLNNRKDKPRRDHHISCYDNRGGKAYNDEMDSSKKRRNTVISNIPLHALEAEAISRKISAGSDKISRRQCVKRKSSVPSSSKLGDCFPHSRTSSSRSSSYSLEGSKDRDSLFLVSPTERVSSENQLDVVPTAVKSSFFRYRQHLSKEEYAYRQVLVSVVSPLGVPDHRPGYRPLELAHHLKEVFGVENKTHEKCVAEAQNNKILDVVLSVQVVEARTIVSADETTAPDPYCVLAITDPRVSRVSPRGTPKSSPRSSPTLARKRFSASGPATDSPITVRKRNGVSGSISFDLEVRRTQIVKDTSHPRWHEEFEMEVKDINQEVLQVFLWDDMIKGELPNMTEKGRPSAIKNFFKQISGKLSFDCLEGYIGHCKINLRDIPANGSDRWYDLYLDRKLKSRAPGQIRLRLQLGNKLCQDGTHSTESDLCSIEDYHYVVQKLYSHEMSRDSNNPQSGSALFSVPTVFQQLPGPSKHVLQQFASQNHLPRISQNLMELVVILECLSEGLLDCESSQKLLKSAIVNLEMEWLTLTSGSHNDLDELGKTVTDTEMELFDKAASEFITHAVKECKLKSTIPKLYPPQNLNKEQLNKSLGTSLTLLNLHLWSTPAHMSSQSKVTDLVTNRLQEDVWEWIDKRLSSVEIKTREGVLSEGRTLTRIVEECITNITPLYSITQEFNRLGLDYYRVVSLALESRVASKAQELMLFMDQYQLRYHRYNVNIRDSSQVSLLVYMALKRFAEPIKTHVSQRDVFRVSIFRYQDWFSNSVVFWLQTFKEESINRMEKALEIDKDVVQVTSLLKYSNSSVDVLSCFGKIVSEWTQIEFRDADISLLGVTKITETICDGVIHYVDKIEQILEKNGYYDFIENQQFDITDQLCITLNNISHVRRYLQELCTRLKWKEVCHNMSLEHEDERVGQQAMRTLRHLVAGAEEDAYRRTEILADRIIEKISDDLYRYTIDFIQWRPDKTSSVDGILQYLETNLNVLVEKLDPTLVPVIIEHIWKTEVEIFVDLLLPGKQPEYYKLMHKHLCSLRDYIQRGGDSIKTGCQCYTDLVEKLKLHSLSSLELIHQYHKEITAEPTTPLLYYGYLELKFGIREFANGTLSLEAFVMRASDMPSVNRKGSCDPYVSIRVLPSPGSCTHAQVKTKVVKDTTEPVFKEYFQFPGLPSYFLSREGTIITFTTWHHEVFLPDDFLGEVTITLDEHTPRIGKRQSIDDLPAIILPLKRTPEPTSGPYKALKDRTLWDVTAKEYVDKRSVVAGYRRPLSVCSPMQFLVSKFKGKTSVTPSHKVSGDVTDVSKG